MIETISFLTSRTGILLVSALAISSLLAWGYSLKVEKLELQKIIAISEADYQKRIATALEKQRVALGAAAIKEQKRAALMERKWKSLQTQLREIEDYDKTAPVSVVRALNSLPKHADNGKPALSARP